MHCQLTSSLSANSPPPPMRKTAHSLLVSVPWCDTITSLRVGSNPTYPDSAAHIPSRYQQFQRSTSTIFNDRSGKRRTELCPISIPSRCYGLEPRVRLAIAPTVPREGRRWRAVPCAGIVGVRPECGDVRCAECSEAHLLLASHECRGRGGLPCIQQSTHCKRRR